MLKYLFELKNRLFLVSLTFISTLFAGFFYKESILFLAVQPLFFTNSFQNNNYFIFTNVTEIFSVYIQLLVFVSSQVTFWFFLYHGFIFFSPALFKFEYLNLKKLLFLSFSVWILASILIYYLLVPFTWTFFSSFQEIISGGNFISLHFEAKLKEYINFYTELHYLSILYSQICILLFLILIYNNSLFYIKKLRKVYYYCFLVFSTILSPPDVISQLIFSLIIIIVYELLVLSFVFNSSSLELVRKPVKANK